jgi:hypothetical protein
MSAVNLLEDSVVKARQTKSEKGRGDATLHCCIDSYAFLLNLDDSMMPGFVSARPARLDPAH